MNVRSGVIRLVAAMAVAGALFGVATAVEAAIPDSSGVIHGCYSKTSSGQPQVGQLRVIDTGIGQSCHRTRSV